MCVHIHGTYIAQPPIVVNYITCACVILDKLKVTNFSLTGTSIRVQQGEAEMCARII